ncbi:hypothetical protein G5714_019034 [Onychostoma macrolepis]|uniref:Uncharacterized protein n=1 Tax=Onychostoma macrolepis TaxID=369639 RepID=A0A7J6C0N5_9TELE|nr:hypothetical protein G5714_019034 [Onychostoma macrolepis]
MRHNRNQICRSEGHVCRFALPKEASSDPQQNSRFIRFNQRTPGEEMPARIAALWASGFELSVALVSFCLSSASNCVEKLYGNIQVARSHAFTGLESADERCCPERCWPDGMMGRRNKARAVWCSHLFRSQHKGSMESNLEDIEHLKPGLNLVLQSVQWPHDAYCTQNCTHSFAVNV